MRKTIEAGPGRAIACTLLFLLVAAAGGDLGHATADGGHGGHFVDIVSAGSPADSNAPAPVSSQIATKCPFCFVGNASRLALTGSSISWVDPFRTSVPALLAAQTLAPSSRHGRPDAARAPPASLSI